jgi:hypothetical protein
MISFSIDVTHKTSSKVSNVSFNVLAFSNYIAFITSNDLVCFTIKFVIGSRFLPVGELFAEYSGHELLRLPYQDGGLTADVTGPRDLIIFINT